MKKPCLKLLFSSLVFISWANLFGQDSGQAQEWPCGKSVNAMVDSGGQPLWIASDELKRHGIEMPSPKLASSLRAVGKIRVDVIVGSTGQVTCVRAHPGHPLLQKAATDAARKWTFRSFSAGANPVSVYGHIDFDFGR